MYKKISTLFITLSLLLSGLAVASAPLLYQFHNSYFSMQLPVSMKLQGQFSTPSSIKEVREHVFVFANYGAKQHKQAVLGRLDPQLRAIITIRRGKFDLKTGPSVAIVLLVDGIRKRRGLDVSADLRMQVYHHLKKQLIAGHEFETYEFKVKNEPVVYQFYAGVIKHRLVSMIWTGYSQNTDLLSQLNQQASKSLATLRLANHT